MRWLGWHLAGCSSRTPVARGRKTFGSLDWKWRARAAGQMETESRLRTIMRIERNQVIAGFPAIQVRRLMRETVGRSISVDTVIAALRCSEPDARRVLSTLERHGLVEEVDGHLEPSLRGSALA